MSAAREGSQQSARRVARATHHFSTCSLFFLTEAAKAASPPTAAAPTGEAGATEATPGSAEKAAAPGSAEKAGTGAAEAAAPGSAETAAPVDISKGEAAAEPTSTEKVNTKEAGPITQAQKDTKKTGEAVAAEKK